MILTAIVYLSFDLVKKKVPMTELDRSTLTWLDFFELSVDHWLKDDRMCNV